MNVGAHRTLIPRISNITANEFDMLRPKYQEAKKAHEAKLRGDAQYVVWGSGTPMRRRAKYSLTQTKSSTTVLSVRCLRRQKLRMPTCDKPWRMSS